MNTKRLFSSALQPLTELKTDPSASPSQPAGVAALALRDVLAEMDSIPSEAILLGVASDGLPVLLNLYDPQPGPMLIAGDPGSGNRTFPPSGCIFGCCCHSSLAPPIYGERDPALSAPLPSLDRLMINSV